MKKYIILLLFAIVNSFNNSYGQSHNYNPGCRFFKVNTQKQGKAVSDGTGCPVCNKTREEERNERKAEDKRRADQAAAEQKANEERIKKEKADALAKELKDAEDNRKREQDRKELEEFSRSQQAFINKLKIDNNKNYAGYDPVKASRAIPAKMKLLKLVENKFARSYELFSGDELIKSFSQEQYWVGQLNQSLPYFILEERQKKLNRRSILNSKGEPIEIGGESHFESIQFNDKNSTIQLELALEAPALLYSGSTADELSGVYNDRSDAKRLVNVIELDKAKRRSIPDEVDSRGNRTVKISGFGINFRGYAAKRIVAAIDLTILESGTVYIVN